MPEDAEVEKLADTLKKSGLAVSHMDAINRAKEILGISNKGASISASNIKPKEEKINQSIKEVDNETEQEKKSIKEESAHHKKHNFNDPDFDISKEDVSLSELIEEAEPAEPQPIMTNDPQILKHEKEAEQVEQIGKLTDEDGDPIAMPSAQEIQSVEPVTHSTVIEAPEEEKKEEKKKPQLTKEEKEMSDLTKLFKFGKS